MNTTKKATLEAAGERAVTASDPHTRKANEWDLESADALAEVERLEAGAGAALLDDPGAAESLPGRVASLRSVADMAGRAATEARRRVQDARVASLLADADALTPEVGKARKALDAHQTKRDQLKSALEEFTGMSWEVQPVPAVGQGGPTRRVLYPAELLTHALEDAEGRQAALRAEADAAASDLEWTPAHVREQVRLRAEWDELLSGYREWAQIIEDTREEIVSTARHTHHDLDDAHIPPWLAKLRERIEYRSSQLAGLPQDVALYRGQGLELEDSEVDALRAEFDLTEDEPEPEPVELEPVAVSA